MGIQGLLPLLKPIQRTRHLSELSGQTIAVDGYVWLHRGAYGCAQDLALGKPTRRYVDFCMARARLLQNHGIAPYLVFDGGPLPAKRGTENEREKKREENMEKAKELMAKGRETQAREFFVKCVDVTPQMAYQVIKALKAENIPYVVSPYEADAQLAYLERMNIVDGILTEDSDLLVFGCQNVFLKLDTVAATVIHIPRKDFGSAKLCVESFSLIGWSDAQFRRMAMLSGCDYLPSIPGIGLRTAYQLLKKHKTVDRAVKMVRLEGKKRIPDGYVESFELAEKVFLYQRVFDPIERRITYLSQPEEDLGEEAEKYIGQILEVDLARRIADGNACPISLEAMEDINPRFSPGTTSKLPLKSSASKNLPSSTPNAKKTGGLLSFFTPVAKSTSSKKISLSSPKTTKVGNASGKRTLIDLMEEDMVVKRKRMSIPEDRTPTSSKFFSDEKPAVSKSSPNKENIPIVIDTDDHEEEEEEEEEIYDPVTQEDGYISPSPSSTSRHFTPELSSPLLSRTRSMPARHRSPTQDFVTQDLFARVIVRGSSEPAPELEDDAVPGPDLALDFGDDEDFGLEEEDRILLHDDASSEIMPWNEAEPGLEIGELDEETESATPPSSLENTQQEIEVIEVYRDYSSVHAKLAQKWRTSFSLQSPFPSSSLGGPRRSGASNPAAAMITPVEERLTPHYLSQSLQSKPKQFIQSTSPSPLMKNSLKGTRTCKGPRASDPFPIQCGTVASATRKPKADAADAVTRRAGPAGSRAVPISIDDDEIEDAESQVFVSTSARGRLQAFRFST